MPRKPCWFARVGAAYYLVWFVHALLNHRTGPCRTKVFGSYPTRLSERHGPLSPIASGQIRSIKCWEQNSQLGFCPACSGVMLLIIVAFDVGEQAAASLVLGRPWLLVDEFDLEGIKQALHGIAVVVACSLKNAPPWRHGFALCRGCFYGTEEAYGGRDCR